MRECIPILIIKFYCVEEIMVPAGTGRIYEAREAWRYSPQQNREDSTEHNLLHRYASFLGLGSVSGSLGAKAGSDLVSKVYGTGATPVHLSTVVTVCGPRSLKYLPSGPSQRQLPTSIMEDI